MPNPACIATWPFGQNAIRTALPDAAEVIAYNIPAYRLDGRVALYFAWFKAHYSIYPASDAIFYITTRTPSTDAEWRGLETRTAALAEAATALTTPVYFRDRARWMSDAQLLIDASAAALAAVRRRDVAALEQLNEPLYTACVQCHQDYSPNYGRRLGATS